jgi:Flp pilus assembly protein protease CpaA
VRVEDDTAQVTSQRRRDLMSVIIVNRVSTALPTALFVMAVAVATFALFTHAGYPVWANAVAALFTGHVSFALAREEKLFSTKPNR